MNTSAQGSKEYDRKESAYGPNLSFTDRQLRYIGGIALIAVPLAVAPETVGMWSILMLSSIPLIATAILGWDPIYALVGKNNYVEGEAQIEQRCWTCPNLGRLDRIARLGMGAGLIMTLLAVSTMNAEMVLTLLAIPLIVSAITAWDPFYAAMNINSFASRVDVSAAEPEASEQTMAACYNFPQRLQKAGYSRAA